MEAVARFCDERQVGDVGALGFRRSSELGRVLPCLERLVADRILFPEKTRFLDMGCADGRVNLLLGYVTRVSVGIELDDWILDDHSGLKQGLEAELSRLGLLPLPANVRLFSGDSTDDRLHDTIEAETGTPFEAFDLFYTYLTMQEEFAALIAGKAKPGAVFAVYGLEHIQPRLPGFELLTPGRALHGILALYRKK
ncbi:MAG: hypothetical protein ACQET7_02080 [Thermodesulfobacteriota bacterium]